MGIRLRLRTSAAATAKIAPGGATYILSPNRMNLGIEIEYIDLIDGGVKIENRFL
jgi:hypothetical protein